MKCFIERIYSVLFLIIILFFSAEVFAKDSKIKYSQKNISNYFLGVISANQDYTNEAYKYLNKTQSLKRIHDNFNIKFIQTLILLEKLSPLSSINPLKLTSVFGESK